MRGRRQTRQELLKSNNLGAGITLLADRQQQSNEDFIPENLVGTKRTYKTFSEQLKKIKAKREQQQESNPELKGLNNSQLEPVSSPLGAWCANLNLPKESIINETPKVKVQSPKQEPIQKEQHKEENQRRLSGLSIVEAYTSNKDTFQKLSQKRVFFVDSNKTGTLQQSAYIYYNISTRFSMNLFRMTMDNEDDFYIQNIEDVTKQYTLLAKDICKPTAPWFNLQQALVNDRLNISEYKWITSDQIHVFLCKKLNIKENFPSGDSLESSKQQIVAQQQVPLPTNVQRMLLTCDQQFEIPTITPTIYEKVHTPPLFQVCKELVKHEGSYIQTSPLNQLDQKVVKAVCYAPTPGIADFQDPMLFFNFDDSPFCQPLLKQQQFFKPSIKLSDNKQVNHTSIFCKNQYQGNFDDLSEPCYRRKEPKVKDCTGVNIELVVAAENHIKQLDQEESFINLNKEPPTVAIPVLEQVAPVIPSNEDNKNITPSSPHREEILTLSKPQIQIPELQIKSESLASDSENDSSHQEEEQQFEKLFSGTNMAHQLNKIHQQKVFKILTKELIQQHVNEEQLHYQPTLKQRKPYTRRLTRESIIPNEEILISQQPPEIIQAMQLHAKYAQNTNYNKKNLFYSLDGFEQEVVGGLNKMCTDAGCQPFIKCNSGTDRFITVFCKFCNKYKLHYEFVRDENGNKKGLKFERCLHGKQHDIQVRHQI